MEFITQISKYAAEHPDTWILIRMGLSVVITVILFFLISWILRILEKFALKSTSWEFDEQLIAYLRIPARRLILLIGGFFFMDSFSHHLGETYKMYMDGGFYVMIVLQITMTVNGLIGKAGSHLSERMSQDNMLSGKEEFIPLGVRVLKIVIFVIALIIVLKHFNQNVESLVVSLGVGSLAVALAAQDTLSNMIAGFVIMTDRPFRVGDRIMLPSGEKGDVFEIGLRSTKVLTFANTLIIVPNAEIVKSQVINLSYPDPTTRVKVTVGVAYGTDVGVVKTILEDACKANPKVLEDPIPVAYFLDFGASSLDFQVTCRVADWKDEWPVAEEIRADIYRRLDEHEIEIPFPQRTVWWGEDQKPESPSKPDENYPED